MAYEYERDDSDEGGARVLWGRLAAGLALLVLAFVAGTQCSDDGVSRVELERSQQRVAALEEQRDQLSEQVAQLSGDGGGDASADGEAEATGEATGDATEEPAADSADTAEAADEGEAAAEGGAGSYEVAAGDTLYTIATDRCGSAEQVEAIVELNGLESDTLNVGQTLQLPPDCAGG